MDLSDMNIDQRRNYILREMDEVNYEAERNIRSAVDEYAKLFLEAFAKDLAKAFGPRLSQLPNIPLHGTWGVHQAFNQHLKSTS